MNSAIDFSDKLDCWRVFAGCRASHRFLVSAEAQASGWRMIWLNRPLVSPKWRQLATRWPSGIGVIVCALRAMVYFTFWAVCVCCDRVP